MAAEGTNTESTTLTRSSTESWSIASGSQSGLNPSGSFSIVMWVNPTSTAGITQWWMTKEGTTTNRLSYAVGYDGTNILFFVSPTGNDPENKALTVAQALSNGTWYRLTFVFTASTRMEIFLNNTSIANTTTSVPANAYTTSTNVYIGAFSGNQDTANAQMDSVYFYARALSSGDVSGFAPCNPDTTNLVSWWRFNGDGADSQGSNTLTGNNTPTFTSNVAYNCAVGPITLETWNTVAKANIETMDTVALANIESWDTVA